MTEKPGLTPIPSMTRVTYDVYADFPAAGNALNDLAYATDLLILYYWNGTAWTAIASAPTNVVLKTGDQVISNSAVLTNDTELLFPIAANEIWTVRFVLRATTRALSDMKVSMTAPAGAVGRFMRTEPGLTLAATRGVIEAFGLGAGAFILTDADTTENFVIVEGIIWNGANAGNIQLQWCQGTAIVENTVVQIYSYMSAQRLN